MFRGLGLNSKLYDRIDAVALLKILKSSRISRWVASVIRPTSAVGHSSPSSTIDPNGSGQGPSPPQVDDLVDWYLRQYEHGQRPSIAETMAQHASATPTERTALLCAELAQRWKLGEQIPAEQFFSQYPTLLAARENAIDLIYAEYRQRETCGQSDVVEMLAKRFPLFADDLVTQIDLHQALAGTFSPAQDSLALDSAEPEDQAKTRLYAASDPTLDRPLANLYSNNNQPPESSAPQIQGYDILKEIGRGGMGVVFKARHRQLDRFVALKMLLEGPFSKPEHARRFLVEAKASARLQHPGIVQIYEVGQHEGRPFLAFEYIDGGTLAEHIRGRPLQPNAAAAIVESLSRAVQFAHEHSVVHRDLKPGNVMLQQVDTPAHATSPSTILESNQRNSDSNADRDNPDAQLLHRFRFKITDFGLAKFVEEHAEQVSGATVAGDIMGTAAYMSPEQARGDSPKSSPASDIYSLGAIFYELLTGRPPFVGTRPIEVLAQVVADDPVRPSQLVRRMPADLQTICLKCLEKNPNRRYGSALELAEELARFQANIPIIARHTTTLERGWRWCRRHPAISVSLTSIAALLLSISVMTTVYSVLLKDQLKQTKTAEVAENNAKKQAIQRLWGSYLAEANAKRNSRQIGQRFEGLAAIESARLLADSIGIDEPQVAKMREAAIACMALPDVQVLGEFSRSIRPERYINFDRRRTLYAYLSNQDHVVVNRCNDNQTIAEFKDIGRSVPVLSPDGQWLMVLNDHCRVFRLNVTPVEQVFETRSQGWWSFAPDSTHILGTNGDGSLQLIDVATGTAVRSYSPLVAFFPPVFSPDNSKAALVTGEAVEVLDLKTGNTVQSFNRPSVTEGSQHCAWHPNGSVLAVGPYETEGVVLWDVVTGAKLDAIGMWGGSFTLSFNSTGSLLLGCADWGATLSVWNTETRQLEFGQTGYSAMDVKPNSNGGFSLLKIDGGVLSTRVVEPSSVLRALPKPLGWHMTRTSPNLVYSIDGRYLAHGCNGHVVLYEMSSTRELDRVVIGGDFGFVGFDHNGSLLTLGELGLFRWPVSAGVGDSAQEIDLGNRTTSIGPPVKIGEGSPTVMLAVSKDGRQFAVSNDEGALVYRDEAPGNPMFVGPHPDVRSISFSADGSLLATGGWTSGTARIWDLKSGQLLKTLDEPICCTVEFSPDGKFLVTNSNRVCIWSVENWEMLSTVNVQGASPSGVNVCFSPDGRLLAVSESGARIHLADPATGKIITTLTNPHQAGTSQMEFSPAGDHLAVASGDSVFVWDLVALHESLVSFGLGSPQLEARLATSLAWRFEKRGQQDASNTRKADHENSVSNKPLPTEFVSVKFLLDEHFQQLRVVELFQRAQIAVERGELSAARVLVEQAISQKPNSANTCNNLAWLLATGPPAIRDGQQAVTLARRAVELASDQATYFNTLGVALYRTGKYSEAITALEKSLGHNDPFNQPYDLIFLAMCHSRLGDSAKAHEFQERALKLMTAHGSGRSKVWQEELQEFVKELRETLADKETSPAIDSADFD